MKNILVTGATSGIGLDFVKKTWVEIIIFS